MFGLKMNDELKVKIDYIDDKGKAKSRWESEEIKLSEDRDYLYYDTKLIRTPKISSHTLVDLTGANKYTSRGRTILTMFGLTKRGEMDQYQVYKGGIAEVFAERYLYQKFGSSALIEAFTTTQFENYNQFPEAAPFSGVLDLMMHAPKEMTIEVKSKEMKDYELIAEKGMHPRDQVMQGANQAILANSTEYMMVWVFLEPDLSKMLKQISAEDLWLWKDNYELAADHLGITMDDFKFYSKEFEADPRIIGAYRKKAVDLYDDFYTNKRVSKKLFKAGELKEIRAQIEVTKRES